MDTGNSTAFRRPVVKMITADRYQAASDMMEQKQRGTDSGRHRIQEVKLEPEEGPGIDVAEKNDIESSHQLDANPAN